MSGNKCDAEGYGLNKQNTLSETKVAFSHSFAFCDDKHFKQRKGMFFTCSKKPHIYLLGYIIELYKKIFFF